MGSGIKKLIDNLEEYLDGLTKEDIERMEENCLKPQNVPKGWVSIEEYLPRWLSEDVAQGYTEYLVKDNKGFEFFDAITDHTAWYYDAKELGITHWFNDKDL